MKKSIVFVMLGSYVNGASIISTTIIGVHGVVPSAPSSGDSLDFRIEFATESVSRGSGIVLVRADGGVQRGSFLSVGSGRIDSNHPSILGPELLLVSSSEVHFGGNWTSGDGFHNESISFAAPLEDGYGVFELSAVWSEDSMELLDGLAGSSSDLFVSGEGTYTWFSSRPSTAVPIGFPQPESYSIDFTVSSITVIPEPSVSLLLSLSLGMIIRRRK